MKKLIAMLLAMVMVLGLVACAAKTEPPAADTKTETPAAETPAAETPAEETPAEETPAAEGAVKTDVIATEGKAAELGIPAAVVLQDTTALEGKKIGCSICATRATNGAQLWHRLWKHSAHTTALTSSARTAT